MTVHEDGFRPPERLGSKSMAVRAADRLALIGAAAATLWLLTGFALVTLFFAPSGWPPFDRAATHFTVLIVRRPVEPLLSWVYLLGVPIVSAVLAFVLAGTVLITRGWKAALLALSTLGMMAALEGALRVRFAGLPWADPASLLGHQHVWHLVNSTYPSGHTARVVATMGIAAYLFPRRWAPVGFAVAILLGGLMAVQRVYVGQHTGSDVIGGLLLGGGMAAFFGAVLPSVSLIGFRRPRAISPAQDDSSTDFTRVSSPPSNTSY